jgi:hypothetical protein
MTKSDPDILAFLARHTGTHAHLAFVARAVDAGVCRLSSFSPSVRTAELLDIYRRRTAHLSSIPSKRAQAVALETQALCDAIEKVQPSAVRIWSLACREGVRIVAFEDHTGKVLLGCVKAYDKSEMPNELWNDLEESD